MTAPRWLAALVGLGVALVLGVLAALRRRPAPLPVPDTLASEASREAHEVQVEQLEERDEEQAREHVAVATADPDERARRGAELMRDL